MAEVATALHEWLRLVTWVAEFGLASLALGRVRKSGPALPGTMTLAGAQTLPSSARTPSAEMRGATAKGSSIWLRTKSVRLPTDLRETVW